MGLGGQIIRAGFGSGICNLFRASSTRHHQPRRQFYFISVLQRHPFPWNVICPRISDSPLRERDFQALISKRCRYHWHPPVFVFQVGGFCTAQPLCRRATDGRDATHPCTGPDCQFVVFSFDSSYSISTSFETLVSVIFRTIQGDSHRDAALIVVVTSHQDVTLITDRTRSIV